MYSIYNSFSSISSNRKVQNELKNSHIHEIKIANISKLTFKKKFDWKVEAKF